MSPPAPRPDGFAEALDSRGAEPPGAPVDRAAEPARRTVLTVLGTTAVVTAVSWLVPSFAATGVGLVFLAATWLTVLRHDERTIRRHGLSLGGLLEPTPLDGRRIGRDLALALGLAALFALVIFPPFWFGYVTYWGPKGTFVFRAPDSVADEVLGQLLVTALPEEAFFRGYLQTTLDAVWAPRWRILGADVGPGLVVSAAIFALGHVLTVPNPARLAVFFPALLFGWLRARTGGIGSSVAFHAACNLFSATLARGYGLVP